MPLPSSLGDRVRLYFKKRKKKKKKKKKRKKSSINQQETDRQPNRQMSKGPEQAFYRKV